MSRLSLLVRGQMLSWCLGRLRRRFILMGLINAVFAPFIVLYLLMYSFFRYFEVRLPPSPWVRR